MKPRKRASRERLPFEAVILDMDGVMVDSEHQWLRAEGPFLSRLIGRWGPEDHRHVVGLSVVDLYHRLVRAYGLKLGKADFLRRCEVLARQIYGRKVTLTPGLREFLSSYRRRRLPLALASSSPASWVAMVLDRFHLRRIFAAVVTGDDAPGRTKPAPDLYLLAATKLGIPPNRCLAVEDSAIGVRAARAAGMFCVGLRTGFNDEQNLGGADLEVRGFSGLLQAVSGLSLCQMSNIKT